MTREIVALVRYGQLGTNEFPEEYRDMRSVHKVKTRRAKRGHVIPPTDKIKENPNKFSQYIKGKKCNKGK